MSRWGTAPSCVSGSRSTGTLYPATVLLCEHRPAQHALRHVRSTAPSRRPCAHRAPPQPPRRPRLLPLADPRRACPSRQHARGHPRSLRRAAGARSATDYNSMGDEGSAMRGIDTDGSVRPRASHACPPSTCYSGNPSRRSVCPRTSVPLARNRLVRCGGHSKAKGRRAKSHGKQGERQSARRLAAKAVAQGGATGDE